MARQSVLHTGELVGPALELHAQARELRCHVRGVFQQRCPFANHKHYPVGFKRGEEMLGRAAQEGGRMPGRGDDEAPNMAPWEKGGPSARPLGSTATVGSV